jgi:hypothetical protein
MTVVCIDDKKLPPGADIVEGKEYEVTEKFINSYDQIVYILNGVENKGRTRFGLPWIGYSSTRFTTLNAKEVAEKEYDYMLN